MAVLFRPRAALRHGVSLLSSPLHRRVLPVFLTAMASAFASPTRTVRQLTDFNATHLQFWLEQKYLNPATDKALRALLALHHEATAFQESLNQLEKERVQIHQEQVRIRENLQTLGDRPSEKDLRERFVRAFGAQEDRLEQIDRESKEKTKQRDACWEKINQAIEKLEYEAAV